MVQLVTRVDDDLVAAIDALVASGEVASRSDAVRSSLRAYIEDHERRRVGRAIAHGYEERPQTDAEVGWADEATARMIADEPW